MSSRPAKPSLRHALNGRSDQGEIERLRRALLGNRDDVRPQVLDAVRQVLAETPDATPFAVCRSVRMRRQDVLAAVRVLRNGREPVPVDGGEA